jgi:hypothetical protein
VDVAAAAYPGGVTPQASRARRRKGVFREEGQEREEKQNVDRLHFSVFAFLAEKA